jgi:hypothetical protein
VVYGGSYKGTLVTTIHGQPVTWGFDATSFGGTNGIPLMTAAISCNPPPNSDPSVMNGELLFATASPYACTVSLTPLAGADRRTQSETLSFATPPGELIVSRAASMNSILVNDENDGGIVFTNTDPNPVTVTGLTLDVAYRYLSTTDRPLVLRILTPDTDARLADYHLENLPTTDSSAYTYGQSGMNAPVTFTIPGSAQKMLPIEILGVTKMLISGSSPAVTVAVRAVATNQASVKTTLSSPTITWTCNVPYSVSNPNDPNAEEDCHN